MADARPAPGLRVETPVPRAADADIAAVLAACRSARDRLIVLLLARAGVWRGEAAGLRRCDVHLLADSRPLGCGILRPHLHVVRREDNPNGAWAKSWRQRVVPLDFLTVQAFDTYQFERMTVPAAAGSDFVLVNLFRPPVGAPVRVDAINDLIAAAAGPGSTRCCARISSGTFSLLNDRVALPSSAGKRTCDLDCPATSSSLPLVAEPRETGSSQQGQSESPHKSSAHGECGEKAHFRLERRRRRGWHRRDRQPPWPCVGVVVTGIYAS